MRSMEIVAKQKKSFEIKKLTISFNLKQRL